MPTENVVPERNEQLIINQTSTDEIENILSHLEESAQRGTLKIQFKYTVLRKVTMLVPQRTIFVQSMPLFTTGPECLPIILQNDQIKLIIRTS